MSKSKTTASQIPASQPESETYSGFTFRLVRKETRSRSGSTPKVFWGLDVNQLIEAKEQFLGSVDWKLIVSKFAQAIDRGLLSAQLNEGSDTYSMSEKLQFAKDYVRAGFGRTVSPKQSEKARLLGANRAMMELLRLMAKPALTDDDVELAVAIGKQFPELGEFVEKLTQD